MSSQGRDTCVLCCHVGREWAIGECNHPVCLVCSARMRVLCGKNECPVCRLLLDQIVVVTTKKKLLQDLAFSKWPSKTQLGMFFESRRLLDKFYAITEYGCIHCPDQHPLRSFRKLKEHAKHQHNLFFCEICVEGLKLFPSEFKLYSRQELVAHWRQGDKDDSSHKGHPSCKFCDERYLDNDTLHKHLRQQHFWCHFCEAEGKQDYYVDCYALRKHFREGHYLCEEGQCRVEILTSAFSNEIDLKAHKASVHGKGMSKAEAKQARAIPVEFTYADHHSESTGGTRRGHSATFQNYHGRNYRDHSGPQGSGDHGGPHGPRDHGGPPGPRDHGGPHESKDHGGPRGSKDHGGPHESKDHGGPRGSKDPQWSRELVAHGHKSSDRQSNKLREKEEREFVVATIDSMAMSSTNSSVKSRLGGNPSPTASKKRICAQSQTSESHRLLEPFPRPLPPPGFEKKPKGIISQNEAVVSADVEEEKTLMNDSWPVLGAAVAGTTSPVHQPPSGPRNVEKDTREEKKDYSKKVTQKIPPEPVRDSSKATLGTPKPVVDSISNKPAPSKPPSSSISGSRIFEDIRRALNYDQEKFKEFQSLSGWYRGGTLSVDRYNSQCVEMFGEEWLVLGPQLAKAMPPGETREKLMSYLSTNSSSAMGVLKASSASKKKTKKGSRENSSSAWVTVEETKKSRSGPLGRGKMLYSEDEYPSLSAAAKFPQNKVPMATTAWNVQVRT